MPLPNNFAVVCDDGVHFFQTELEALADARTELQAIKSDSINGETGVWDGWDEAAAESVLVLQVIHRAAKTDPDAPYLNVDYAMAPVTVEPPSDTAKTVIDLLRRAIEALNVIPNFTTPEGIKSYALLSELDAAIAEIDDT